ncbi:phosphoglycerate kinase [Metamycoplasma hominis]|uniref:phosphoglycerate kinase n=1 Tax=Metamycoplasma hominis TaxID=2098 RepID=UPI0017462E1D|nr:phosphoglycerate kinase [Metamycoplasma hominis]MBD3898931.1 phosphoglycerate kinase [Metamycoplasma hominis]MCZ2781500.1 phosphoglycerate kinase [Metamycoplasma hominis]
MKKTIEDLQLENKKVILRVDFNVPISNNTIMDTKRIDEELPTIKYILSKNASLIILSHLGRVKTEEDKKTKSLEIVAKKLAQLLNRDVKFINENRSETVTNAAKNLKPGEILVLENTRFQDLNNKAESNNDEDLAKYWASLGDVYVNDAFGTAHRAHASTYGISQYSKESALGFLMNNEVEHLQKLLVGFKRPFVAIIGGAKVSDKIKVLEKLFELADKVLIVGGMAYTFQKALNRKIGTSIFEEDKVEMAKEYLNKYKDKIVLPIDNAYVDEFADKTPKFTSPENPDIPDGNMGLDIGPESIKLFASIIKNAKTIFWNGPAGVTEFSNFEAGTKGIATAIAQNRDCYSVVGGGDSVTAINKLGYQDKFSFISTGGGASIEFVQGKKLPGIEAIQDK